jgi:hypothetical protein
MASFAQNMPKLVKLALEKKQKIKIKIPIVWVQKTKKICPEEKTNNKTGRK